MLRRLLVLPLALALGCPTPRTPDDAPTERRRSTTDEFVGEPVAVPPQFGYGGCTPLAETELLEGEVVVMPFGKGTDGVVIDDGKTKWVVSYDASGVFADFEKDRVVARGQQCAKQGAAVRAHHFEVMSLRVLR